MAPVVPCEYVKSWDKPSTILEFAAMTKQWDTEKECGLSWSAVPGEKPYALYAFENFQYATGVSMT